MPRDSNGNYTLPAGNPVVAATVIEASWANGTMSDVQTAMTDSLSRSGQGGMLQPFTLVDGTVSLPGLAFVSESSSGWYRAAPQDVRMAIAGVQKIQVTATAIVLATTLTVAGAATFSTSVATPSVIENGTALTAKYLGITATATDSLSLGGELAVRYPTSTTDDLKFVISASVPAPGTLNDTITFVTV